MPLPRATETAATQIAQIVARFDADLLDYIARGDDPPTVDAAMRRIRPLILRGVTAALQDANAGPVPAATILAATNRQYDAIREQLRAALSEARRQRRRVPRSLPEQDGDESLAAFVRRVGKVAALAAVVKATRKLTTQRAAQMVGARPVRPVSAYARMVARTESAIARNDYAATVADAEGLVVFVEDARKGPTDQACEDVNGRYATPEWMRRHPVEHPNCTRRGRPTRLPRGATVTLLR